MSGFRDKQHTLVNTVGVPGDAGASPGKSRGGMPKNDPAAKLIILRRSHKTSLIQGEIITKYIRASAGQ
jgi:hypothetical protein